MNSIQDFVKFSLLLADASEAEVMKFYRESPNVSNKAVLGHFDPVTTADYNTEKIIRSLILSHYPDHGIIGEEFGKHQEDAEYVWVLDPIDGTKSFICGMPSWATLICLLRHKQPILGLINQPFLKERFIGYESSAYAFINAQKQALKTRKCASLLASHVYIGGSMTTHPLLPPLIERLKNKVELLRVGGDAYALAMLAKGHIDIIIDGNLELFDIAAHVPLIGAAGGFTGNWAGQNILSPDYFLAVGNIELAQQIGNLIGNLMEQ